MAKRRTYKQPSVVSGLSVQDILNVDLETFNKWTESDLRKVVGRLVSAGNKRLRTFERSEESSPAYRHVMKSGGHFSVAGKSIDQLRAEYKRARDFMTAQTGTKKGWLEVKKDTIASLEKQGVHLTVKQFDKMWETYEKLKELDESVSLKSIKYTILQDISDQITDPEMDPDQLAVELSKTLDKRYQDIKRQEAIAHGGGVSSLIK